MESAMTSKVIKGQIKRFTHYLIRLLPNIRLHCLWIRPLVMEVQEFVLSAGPVEKLFFCNLQVQKNTRIKYLRLKQ